MFDLAEDDYAARFDGHYPTTWDELSPEQQAAAGLDEDHAPEVEDTDEDQDTAAQ
ncbi:hypothetical protein [Kocuria marina]|uniref:hypothetical protein n=1 Tax=Kocuria marina TaxID=223184 RepID=UPI0015CF528C